MIILKMVSIINSKNILEVNGSGEVLWDKTINETFSILSNNRPYYIEMQTKKGLMMILIILNVFMSVF